MCGICGVIFEQKDRTAKEYSTAAVSITTLLILNQSRGHHATGVAVVKNDGGLVLVKRPKPASLFIRTDEYTNALHAIGEDTTIVLGHARWATRGTPRVNANNQPVMANGVVGVHNGTIRNADEIADRKHIDRHAEVDSEVLFALAGNFTRNSEFGKALAPVQGYMSAGFVRLRNAKQLHLLKGNKPLFAMMDNQLRAIFFSSELSHLRIALRNRSTTEIVLPTNRITTLDARSFKKVGQTKFEFKGAN